jgi:hypothetical protein
MYINTGKYYLTHAHTGGEGGGYAEAL